MLNLDSTKKTDLLDVEEHIDLDNEKCVVEITNFVRVGYNVRVIRLLNHSNTPFFVPMIPVFWQYFMNNGNFNNYGPTLEKPAVGQYYIGTLAKVGTQYMFNMNPSLNEDGCYFAYCNRCSSPLINDAKIKNIVFCETCKNEQVKNVSNQYGKSI